MTSNSRVKTSAALNVLDRLRHQVRERRQARVAYDALQRELAAHRTPSEIADLMAAVNRHPDAPQAEQIRHILERNLSDYRRNQRLAG